jgi:hypothetical protein
MRMRCISEMTMPTETLIHHAGDRDAPVEIERVVIKPKHSDVLVAEFWHEHSKICFAYTVNRKPYIQLHGGQMDLEKAKATGVALDLAYDWLMEQANG